MREDWFGRWFYVYDMDGLKTARFYLDWLGGIWIGGMGWDA